MDCELCDLIMILDSKDKMENLQQKITDFYTYDNFRVNDPKSVSGGKRIDIEKHSAKDNKEVKLKISHNLLLHKGKQSNNTRF